MPNCFTCHQEITFDKNIRSKSGKQIPLTPDKRYAHSHDQEGNPINQPLPNQQPQQTASYSTTSPQGGFQFKSQPQQESQGGVTLDTKRLRVMLEEQGQRLQRIEEKLEYNTQVDTNKLIGQLQQINDTIAPFLNTQGVVASELLKDKKSLLLSPEPK